MQTAIYDPDDFTTPYLRAFQRAHVARQRRINRAAAIHRMETAERELEISRQRANAAAAVADARYMAMVSALVPVDPAAAFLHTMWFFDLVADIAPSAPKRRYPRVEDIQKAVAEYYGVSLVDLSCKRRTADVIWPRHVAMYLAKTLTLKSLPEIGRRFGKRDHTTVLHAVRKLESRILKDAARAQEVAEIEQAFGVSG